MELEKSETDRANALKIVEYLNGRQAGATRREISDDCFQRNASASKIDEAIRMLLAASPPKITAELTPRADGRPGRGSIRYKLFSSSHNEVNECYEVRPPTRARANSDDYEVYEDSFSDQGAGDLTSLNSYTVETAETRATSLTSSASLTSFQEKRKSLMAGDRI
jgi:hypothetical protein